MTNPTTDPAEIRRVVDDIVAANPEKAEQARAKPALQGWFVGKTMQQLDGNACQIDVNDAVRASLGFGL